jgi:hypothetical protein
VHSLSVVELHPFLVAELLSVEAVAHVGVPSLADLVVEGLPVHLSEVVLHELLSEGLLPGASREDEAPEKDLETHKHRHQQDVSVSGRKGERYCGSCCCEMGCVHVNNQ